MHHVSYQLINLIEMEKKTYFTGEVCLNSVCENMVMSTAILCLAVCISDNMNKVSLSDNLTSQPFLWPSLIMSESAWL